VLRHEIEKRKSQSGIRDTVLWTGSKNRGSGNRIGSQNRWHANPVQNGVLAEQARANPVQNGVLAEAVPD
jgi:hypothetical protein